MYPACQRGFIYRVINWIKLDSNHCLHDTYKPVHVDSKHGEWYSRINPSPTPPPTIHPTVEWTQVCCWCGKEK